MTYLDKLWSRIGLVLDTPRGPSRRWTAELMRDAQAITDFTQDELGKITRARRRPQLELVRPSVSYLQFLWSMVNIVSDSRNYDAEARREVAIYTKHHLRISETLANERAAIARTKIIDGVNPERKQNHQSPPQQAMENNLENMQK